MLRSHEAIFAGVTCIGLLVGCSSTTQPSVEVPVTSSTVVTKLEIGEPLMPNNREILPAAVCGELNQMLAGVELLLVSGFDIATKPDAFVPGQGLFAQRVAEIVDQSADMLPQTLDQLDGTTDGNYDIGVYSIETVADALIASKSAKEASSAAIGAISPEGLFVYEQIPPTTKLLEQARQTIEITLSSHC